MPPLFSATHVVMSEESNTEILEKDAEVKGASEEQKESSNQPTDESASAQKETSVEKETAVKPDSNPQTSQTQAALFKVPNVPPQRVVVERPVEHIHFDKKWAAKRGKLPISYLIKSIHQNSIPFPYQTVHFFIAFATEF